MILIPPSPNTFPNWSSRVATASFELPFVLPSISQPSRGWCIVSPLCSTSRGGKDTIPAQIRDAFSRAAGACGMQKSLGQHASEPGVGKASSRDEHGIQPPPGSRGHQHLVIKRYFAHGSYHHQRQNNAHFVVYDVMMSSTTLRFFSISSYRSPSHAQVQRSASFDTPSTCSAGPTRHGRSFH